MKSDKPNRRLGELNKNAKLNRAEVYLVRRQYDAGENRTRCAKAMGMSRRHFNAIGRRIVWTWLPEE